MFELMVILFIVGYVFIALEHTVNINKAATALFMGISLWVVYILGAESISQVALIEGRMVGLVVELH